MNKNRLSEMFKDRKKPQVYVDVELDSEMDQLELIRKSMLGASCCCCGGKYPRAWPPFPDEAVEPGWGLFYPHQQAEDFRASFADNNGVSDADRVMFFMHCPNCISEDASGMVLRMQFKHKTDEAWRQEYPDGTLLITVAGIRRDDCPEGFVAYLEDRASETAQGRQYVLRFAEDVSTGPELERTRIMSTFMRMTAERSMEQSKCVRCSRVCDGDPDEEGWMGMKTFELSKIWPFWLCRECQ